MQRKNRVWNVTWTQQHLQRVEKCTLIDLSHIKIRRRWHNQGWLMKWSSHHWSNRLNGYFALVTKSCEQYFGIFPKIIFKRLLVFRNLYTENTLEKWLHICNEKTKKKKNRMIHEPSWRMNAKNFTFSVHSSCATVWYIQYKWACFNRSVFSIIFPHSIAFIHIICIRHVLSPMPSNCD